MERGESSGTQHEGNGMQRSSKADTNTHSTSGYATHTHTADTSEQLQTRNSEITASQLERGSNLDEGTDATTRDGRRRWKVLKSVTKALSRLKPHVETEQEREARWARIRDDRAERAHEDDEY